MIGRRNSLTFDFRLWTFDFFRERAFEGVGDEGIEGAGGDRHFPQGGGDAENNPGVLGLLRGPPALPGFAVDQLQAIGCNVLGQAEVSRVFGFGGFWQVIGEPVSDVLDDLPDTGLGERRIGGGLAEAAKGTTAYV